VPVAHTLELVARVFGDRRGTILEVGAGEAHVSQALRDAGHRVTSLDVDAEAVAAAAARGVEVLSLPWPAAAAGLIEERRGSFDAVLFVRSMHHLDALDPAVARAFDVLAPHGRLIVEDFAFTDMPRSAVEWFARVVHRFHDAGWWRPTPDGFATKAFEHGVAALDLEDEHHDLHRASAIDAALARAGRVELSTDAPYYYRYLVDGLREVPAAVAALADLRVEEEAAIRAGRLWALGRRWIVAPRD
jgi:SAM-dependent methyltransferase